MKAIFVTMAYSINVLIFLNNLFTNLWSNVVTRNLIKETCQRTKNNLVYKILYQKV